MFCRRYPQVTTSASRKVSSRGRPSPLSHGSSSSSATQHSSSPSCSSSSPDIRSNRNGFSVVERFGVETFFLSAGEAVVCYPVRRVARFLNISEKSSLYCTRHGVSHNPLTPIQANENEFHIHPCFRPALNALKPTGLEQFVSVNFRAAQIVHGNVGQVIGIGPGRDVRLRSDREFALIESLLQSCRRILRQLGRSHVPAETRQQISEQIGLVMSGAAETLDRMEAGGSGDSVRQVVKAADYLAALAQQLVQNGVDDGNVAERIRDEAQNLLAQIGGKLPS